MGVIFYTYESTFRPSELQIIKFNLFRVRDNLINLKIEKKNKLDDNTFNLLLNAVNGTINRLEKIDFFFYFKFYQFLKKHQEILKQTDYTIENLQKIEDPQVISIFNEIIDLNKKAFKINTASLLFMAFPILLIYKIIYYFGYIKPFFRQQLKRINFTQESIDFQYSY